MNKTIKNLIFSWVVVVAGVAFTAQPTSAMEYVAQWAAYKTGRIVVNRAVGLCWNHKKTVVSACVVAAGVCGMLSANPELQERFICAIKK